MPAPRTLSAKKRFDAIIAALDDANRPSHADLAIPLPRKMLPGRCARCRHRGYTVARHPVNDRPWFKCGQCGDEWLCGESGGEWLTDEGRAALLEPA